MAWTASLDVSGGDATKETDYDQLVANVEYLQTLSNAEHNFHISTGTGYHKAMTVAGTMTVGANTDGHDVKFFGNADGSYLLWDESADDLIFTNAGIAVGSDATGDIYYRDASGFLERLAASTNGHVLTSTGAGAVPAWEAIPSSGPTLTGSTAETICTVTGANAFQGEANLRFDGSELYINDTENGGVATGLTINQGANNDHVLTFKQSAVAHKHEDTANPTGTQQTAETDDFATFSMVGADSGGLHIQSISEHTPGRAMIIASHGGTAQTSRAVSADCLITIYASEHDNATPSVTRNVTTNGNVFAVGCRKDAGNRMIFIVDSDGDLHVDGSATVGTYDHEPDALMMRAGRHGLLNGGAPLWLDAPPEEVRRLQDVLEENEVITWNRKEDGGDGIPFLCVNRAVMVAWDGIYQAHGEREELRKELAELRQQNIQLASRLNLLEN